MSLEDAVTFLLENPLVEKGYEDLKRRYESCGMLDDADALGFLIRERFNANHTDPDKEQRVDGSKDT
jgi:hypothetical protein